MTRRDITLPDFHLPRFKRRHGVPSSIKQGTVLVLTPLGKQKADSFAMDGMKFDILSTMAESGPCTIADIANETGLPDRKVQAVLKALVRSGYVRVASSEEG